MTTPSTQIEYFKKAAKILFKQAQADNAEAKERMSKVLKDTNDITLMKVQHVIAVESGFLKWEDLIKATEFDLRKAIIRNKNRTGTPLGRFYRGAGDFLPTPENEALADFLDTMNMEEQRRYLDEDARRSGFFRD